MIHHPNTMAESLHSDKSSALSSTLITEVLLHTTTTGIQKEVLCFLAIEIGSKQKISTLIQKIFKCFKSSHDHKSVPLLGQRSFFLVFRTGLSSFSQPLCLTAAISSSGSRSLLIPRASLNLSNLLPKRYQTLFLSRPARVFFFLL